MLVTVGVWFAVALAADRVELPVGLGDDVHVVPAGDLGAVVVHETEAKHFELTGLDRDLGKAWTVPWETDVRWTWRDGIAVGGTAWALFSESPRAVHLLAIDVRTGKPRDVPVVLPGKLRAYDLADLVVQGDEAWFLARDAGWGGATEGGLVHVDLRSGDATEVPVELSPGAKRMWVSRVTPHPERGVWLSGFEVEKLHRTQRVVHVVGAKPAEVFVAPSPDDLNLLSAQHARLPDGTDWLIGTWSSRPKGSFSNGLYVYTPGTGALKTTSFTQLEHFFDHLPEKLRERLQARIAAREAEGDDLELSFNLLLHDLLATPEGPVLVGEAFVPTYVTRTRTETVYVNGAAQTRTVTERVFNGWLFTHALVVRFQPDGTPAWDASFKLGDVKSFAIRPHVRVAVAGNRVSMTYAWGRRTWTQVVESGKVVSERARVDAASVGVPTIAEADSAWWYGTSFLTWGVQRVPDEEAGRRERMFVVERLSP